MSGTVTLLLAILAAALAGLLVWCRRNGLALTRAAEELSGIVRAGRFAARVSTDGSAGALGNAANELLDQVSRFDARLASREQVIGDVLTSLHEAVAVHRDTLVFANDRFAALVGAKSGAELLGKPFSTVVHHDYEGLVGEYLKRKLRDQPSPTRLEVELHPTVEQTARVELACTRIDYQGLPALLITLVEMGPRTTASTAVTRVRPTAWETLDSIGEGVITTDAGGHIDYMNQAAEQLMGVAAPDALGKLITEIIALVDENDRRSLGDPVKQCLASKTRVSVGRRGLMVSRSGETERSVELSASPLKNQRSEVVGAVVVVRDVSEMRGLTQQMSYQASHDALTGLANRREFERRVQESLESARSNSARHALCYLDLDRFKAVNDSCGHAAGDSMLREVAALIKDTVRDSDTVGRLGGDEFGLLLAGCPLEKARQIADDVVQKVNDYRFVWKDKIFTIGVSVGLVEVSSESGALEEVISAADSACYVAKKQGNHVHVYSSRDEAAARHRGEIQWLQKLQSALKDGRFELLMQPIVATSSTTGDGPAFEVLLRLQDDAVPGGIPPSEFLRAAERYRLMGEVDRWVVQNAFTALGRGGIRLPVGRSLAINLSGQTLGDPQFLEFVVDCLDRTGVSPHQICFEVTENSVITNMEHSRRFIGVLHGMGCHFALDDFGRGLSSFGNLKNLALDYLKIDGSFISNLAADTVNQALVAAMIKLARTLKFKVVAEHVEDMGALEAAKRMGVDFVQGYQLGRPQPMNRVAAARAV
jgi:diguanylate cyclase (GGDEF)-like protein/PAS domain S-box-containing protein